MPYRIAVIKGDGIGPEIADQALRVLDRAAEIYDLAFEYEFVAAGGGAIDAYGSPLPEDSLRTCQQSDAVLLAAVGGPKWDSLPVDKRPEKGLLGLRSGLSLFANLRPAIIYNALREACPLKDRIIGDHLDILVMRELTGDVYFGEKGGDDQRMYDIMNYTAPEVERIARLAFESARTRSGRVTSVDKANVLATSKLWRSVVDRVASDYPDIELSHMYVDNAAMQLIRDPKQFDVILTGNLFGDILSDEASMITGSIGMLPSASLGETTLGMYEPIHGSAPDIAGKGIANPIAMILSCAMMLRYSFSQEPAAKAIEEAVRKVIDDGARTADIADGGPYLSTEQMGTLIRDTIQ